MYIYPNKLDFCFVALLSCPFVREHFARMPDGPEYPDVAEYNGYSWDKDAAYAHAHDVHLSGCGKNSLINV